MRFSLCLSLLGIALLGCQAGDLTVDNTGGSSSSSSSSTSTPAASSTSSTGAAGGAGGARTTSSTGGASATSSTGGAGGTGGGKPAFKPSGFSCSGAMPSIDDVVAITSKDCATQAACHLGDATAQGIYTSYVGVLSEECTEPRLFVKPQDPEHSYVINKITDKNLCGGVPMPNMGTALTSTEIQTIYDWICEGAPDH